MKRLNIPKYVKGLLAVVMTITASSAQSVSVRLDEDLNFRQSGQANGNEVMQRLGTLKRGSVISIPDDVAVYTNGQVDLRKTLERWRTAGSNESSNRPRFTRFDDGSSIKRDLFFPIRIVQAAPGSTAVNGSIQHYMALNYLVSRGKALVLTRDGQVVAPASQVASTRTAAQVTNCTGNCGPQPNSLGSAATEIVRAGLAATVGVRPAQAGTVSGATSAVGSANFTPQGMPSNLPRGCSNFIDANGNYGSYGRIVLREISRHPSFMSGNDLAGICPRFNSFSDEQKRHFRVFSFMALAAQESSCNPNAKAPPTANPNGIAVGLFQMELNANLRYRRDVAYGARYCSDDSRQQNIFSPEVNIRCTAKIMANHIQTGRSLYARARTQYWGPLQSQSNNLTKRTVARYRDCFR